ncbi:MAG: DUF3883 domain-containing protein [Clostridia bacterium]|nr:DUF3883 domain-containing protein [Clostridia bacterium]
MSTDLNRSIFMLRKGNLYKTCPSCSVAYGQDVFYNCPEYFGYRHDNGKPYSQSLCVKCRGRSTPPIFLFDGHTFLENGDIVVPAIRILPLSSKIFESYEKVKEFFLKELPSRGNKYYYKANNLLVEKNTLILFQYAGSIIGYALFEDESTITDRDPNYVYGYRGYYIFAENSIKLLSVPINSEIMFERFSITLSRATSKIKLSHFPILMELLEEGQDDELDEESKNVEEKTIQEISHFSITGIHCFNSTNHTTTAKDYVKAHKNQMAVGVLGEDLIYKYEKEKLISIGRKDLSEKVTIVSSDASLGYDILSFDNEGNEIHIEVKSKASKLKYFDFYISDNEYEKLKSAPNLVIYYLSNLSSHKPFLFNLTIDMINESNMRPVLYRVTLDYEINEL